MSTAFQATGFQNDAFQIDASGVSLALVATEGADSCSALISLTINVGKPMSWVILPSRSYTQRIAAKGIVSCSGKNRLVRGDA